MSNTLWGKARMGWYLKSRYKNCCKFWHKSKILFRGRYCSTLRLTSLHFTSLHFTSLHFTSLQCLIALYLLLHQVVVGGNLISKPELDVIVGKIIRVLLAQDLQNPRCEDRVDVVLLLTNGNNLGFRQILLAALLDNFFNFVNN